MTFRGSQDKNNEDRRTETYLEWIFVLSKEVVNMVVLRQAHWIIAVLFENTKASEPVK